MNELIKINTTNTGDTVVSGRELHNFLEVGRDYTTWMKKMIEYGFEEEKDFTPILGKSNGGRPSVDYIISLDMAKEISMIQRTERGKQARQYFIACERKLKSLAPRTYKDALLALIEAEEQKEQLLLETNKLREEVGFSKEYATVKRMEIYMKQKYHWKPLKDYSKKYGLKIKKVPDVNYEFVNAYHKDAWYNAYDINLETLF